MVLIVIGGPFFDWNYEGNLADAGISGGFTNIYTVFQALNGHPNGTLSKFKSLNPIQVKALSINGGEGGNLLERILTNTAKGHPMGLCP